MAGIMCSNSSWVKVQGSATSEEVLNKAGLNFDVLQEPILDSRGKVIPGYRNNCKNDTHQCLGIVSDKYRVVQNRDAFAFIDGLIGPNAEYLNAGACKNYKVNWIQVKLQPRTIMGDGYNNYLFFKNSFDGGSSVKVCVTPVRIACTNMLNLALRRAKRVFSIRHTGDIAEKIREADMTLELSERYLTEVQEDYVRLARIKFTAQQVNSFWEQLYPIAKDANATTKQNAERKREQLVNAYNANDLGNFRGTAFGVVNAVSNTVSPETAQPLRMTDSWFGNLFDKVTNGHPLLDKAYELVTAKTSNSHF